METKPYRVEEVSPGSYRLVGPTDVGRTYCNYSNPAYIENLAAMLNSAFAQGLAAAATGEGERYKKALEWYATANYDAGEPIVEHGQMCGREPSEVYLDSGTRARLALKHGEGGK